MKFNFYGNENAIGKLQKTRVEICENRKVRVIEERKNSREPEKMLNISLIAINFCQPGALLQRDILSLVIRNERPSDIISSNSETHKLTR